MAARTADLNGDGQFETVVQDQFGFAVVDVTGAPLINYSAPTYNYSRNTVATADVDTYDSYGPGTQNIEILTGNGSQVTYYKHPRLRVVRCHAPPTWIARLRPCPPLDRSSTV